MVVRIAPRCEVSMRCPGIEALVQLGPERDAVRLKRTNIVVAYYHDSRPSPRICATTRCWGREWPGVLDHIPSNAHASAPRRCGGMSPRGGDCSGDHACVTQRRSGHRWQTPAAVDTPGVAPAQPRCLPHQPSVVGQTNQSARAAGSAPAHSSEPPSSHVIPNRQLVPVTSLSGMGVTFLSVIYRCGSRR